MNNLDMFNGEAFDYDPFINNNAYLVLKNKEYFKYQETSWMDVCKRVVSAIVELSDQEYTDQYAEILLEYIPNRDRKTYENPDLTSKTIIKSAMLNDLLTLDCVFSSPVLLNADLINPSALSSCYTVSVRDTIESICETDAHIVKIFQRSGGVGFDISALRPSCDPVRTTSGYAGGIVTFMEKYNCSADGMTRNNKSKRGAIKINLGVWHPDILEFIVCKDDLSKFNYMNISVSMTSDFLNCVKEDTEWNLIFPDYRSSNATKKIYDAEWNGNIEEWTRKGYPIKVYNTIRARELYDMIIEHMWKTGEPGINFQDHLNSGNANKHIEEMVVTNPCGEYTNIPYTSCNLCSINAYHFVKQISNPLGEIQYAFDYDQFSNIVGRATIYMDMLVDANQYPLEKIKENTLNIRPIGIGIMGIASAMMKLRIPYDSKEGEAFIESLFKIAFNIARECSHTIALKTTEFPAWKGSVWEQRKYQIRNSCLLSEAPNGTISTIANVTGGLEPAFALIYYRRTSTGDVYTITEQAFVDICKDYNISLTDELKQKILENKGSIRGLKEFPESMQRVCVTAGEISPDWHLRILAAAQKNIDMAASKTVNLPNEATKEEISDLIFKAYDNEIKGFTCYRDGSRELQTLSTSIAPTNDTKEEPTNSLSNMKLPTRKNLGRMVEGATYQLKNGCGKFYLTINHDSHGRIFEIFHNAKAGGCRSNIDALTRSISFSLQNGLDIHDTLEQFKGISCQSCTNNLTKNQLDGVSCPDIISKVVLEEYARLNALYKINENQNSTVPDAPETIPSLGSSTGKPNNDSYFKNLHSGICPICGGELTGGGCKVCRSCSWSSCEG